MPNQIHSVIRRCGCYFGPVGEISLPSSSGDGEDSVPPNGAGLEDSVPSIFGAPSIQSQAVGKMVTFDVSDCVYTAVLHYCKLAGIDVSKLKPVSTPYCPEGSLHPDREVDRGALMEEASSILMKILWASRLCRPDLGRATCKLATRVHCWSANDDKRLRRLVEYMLGTQHLCLQGMIGDPVDELEIWLFVDADLASDPLDTKSTIGGYMVLVGPSSWFPLCWVHHKQTATSKSTIEAESVALGNTLLQEGYPILDFFETVFGKKIIFRIKEDNTATIKVLKKGYSNKLRHVSRTHKLNLGVVHEAIVDEGILLEHVPTDHQAADAFTKDLAACKMGHALELLGMTTAKLEDSVPSEQPVDDCGVVASGEDSVPPDSKRGVVAACSIIDQALSLLADAQPKIGQDLREHSIRTIVVAHKKTCSNDKIKVRLGGKLPGWETVIVITDQGVLN